MKFLKKKQESSSVSVATLKAHLSKYLRMVKAGEEVIVTDHKTPVAKVVSYDADFQVIPAKRKPKLLSQLMALPASGTTNSLAILLEDRAKR